LFNHFAGAVVTVFTQRFIITGADLFVYNYMQTNPEKFAPHIMDNIRNYMIKVGHLKENNVDHVHQMEQEEEERKKNLTADSLPSQEVPCRR
jgi:hypothetical protein